MFTDYVYATYKKDDVLYNVYKDRFGYYLQNMSTWEVSQAFDSTADAEFALYHGTVDWF